MNIGKSTAQSFEKLFLATGIVVLALGVAVYVWLSRSAGQQVDLTNLWRIKQKDKNITTSPDGTTQYNYSAERLPIPIAP